MKSAYFPESSDLESRASSTSPLEKHLSNDGGIIYDNAGGSKGNLLTFPSFKGLFWDRKPIGPSLNLRSTDMLPLLYLSPHIIWDILQESSRASQEQCLSFNFEKSASLISSNLLDKDQSALYRAAFLAKDQMYFFAMSETTTRFSEFDISIPFYLRSNEKDLVFDENSTRNLLLNLEKSIFSSPQFAIRSYFRIRVAGVCDESNKPSNFLNGLFRFESIVPNVSFVAVPISRIPVFSSPLSTLLLNPSASKYYNGHQFGLLTLNKVRNIVLLVESDSAISRSPLVGAWVHIPYCDEITINWDGNSLLKNPVIWSACVRFLCWERIIDRAWIDLNTFLLVVFVGKSYFCFEMKYFGDFATNRGEMSSSRSTLLHQYLVLDCTLDMSSEGGAHDSIVAKFRPIIDKEPINEFEKRWNVQDTPSVLSLRSSKSCEGSSIMSASELLYHEPILDKQYSYKSESEKDSMEQITPMPQSLSASPLPSPSRRDNERIFSSIPISVDGTISKSSQLQSPNSPSLMDNVRLSTGRHTSPRSPQGSSNYPISLNPNRLSCSNNAPDSSSGFSSKSDPLYPAEVILAQQIQISDLQNEVKALKELLNQLVQDKSGNQSLGRAESMILNNPSKNAAMSSVCTNPSDSNKFDSSKKIPQMAGVSRTTEIDKSRGINRDMRGDVGIEVDADRDRDRDRDSDSDKNRDRDGAKAMMPYHALDDPTQVVLRRDGNHEIPSESLKSTHIPVNEDLMAENKQLSKISATSINDNNIDSLKEDIFIYNDPCLSIGKHDSVFGFINYDVDVDVDVENNPLTLSLPNIPSIFESEEQRELIDLGVDRKTTSMARFATTIPRGIPSSSILSSSSSSSSSSSIDRSSLFSARYSMDHATYTNEEPYSSYQESESILAIESKYL